MYPTCLPVSCSLSPTTSDPGILELPVSERFWLTGFVRTESASEGGLRWQSHGREGPDGSCGPSRRPTLQAPTLGADVLEDEVQVLPAEARRLHELLLGHAAQLQAADVEVAEGDAVGVQLVLVAAELEPFPDVALRPVLGVDGRPVGVAGCTGGERSEGRRPWESLGKVPEGGPGYISILIPCPRVGSGSSPGGGWGMGMGSAGAQATFHSAVKTRGACILWVVMRAEEGGTGALCLGVSRPSWVPRKRGVRGGRKEQGPSVIPCQTTWCQDHRLWSLTGLVRILVLSLLLGPGP